MRIASVSKDEYGRNGKLSGSGRFRYEREVRNSPDISGYWHETCSPLLRKPLRILGMRHLKLLMLLTVIAVAAVETGCAAVVGGAAGYEVAKHCNIHKRHCHR